MNNHGNQASVYNRTIIILLVNIVFFQAGLMVSIIGALIPEIIKTFNLSYTAASVLPLSYYVSFGVLAIPAGLMIERYSYKRVLATAYMVGLAGIFIFAFFQHYYTCVISLFIIGSCLTVAQVTVFPLLREACGSQKLAFHSTFNQFLYGIGAFASPYLYAAIVVLSARENGLWNKIIGWIRTGAAGWSSVYWVFFLLFTVTLIVILFIRFPSVVLKEDEKTGNLKTFRELIANKYVVSFFFVLFAYVACEQGVSNWLTQFLFIYHEVNPATTGAFVLSWYWFLLAAGCVGGMLLLRFFSSKTVLLIFTLMAFVSLLITVFGNRSLAIAGFPLIGLSHSVMWPLMTAMAMNSVSKNHGSLSGLIFGASLGGAFGAFMVGRIGDVFGLHAGLMSLFICYAAILSVYFRSRTEK